MDEQNKQENYTAPTILPAKRRRGRPRRDGGLAKRVILQTPLTRSAPENLYKNSQKDSTSTSTGNNMLGQIVSGVIDGSFDAGYILSVNIGNHPTTLRGLVFEPGRFAPISAANDIAPQVKMYHRSQVIKLQDQTSRNSGQVLPSDQPMSSATLLVVPNNQDDQVLKIQSHSAPSLENLRMVEQDDVMQAFEVANQSEGPGLNAEQANKGIVSQSTLEPNSSHEGTSNLHMDLNEDIHRSNVVDKSQGMGLDQQQVESEMDKNKFNLETSLQPRELVHCDLMKLESLRAPIDDQTRVVPQDFPTINQEI